MKILDKIPIFKKLCTLLDLCVSSLRRGHANLLCIVPILTDDPRRESMMMMMMTMMMMMMVMMMMIMFPGP